MPGRIQRPRLKIHLLAVHMTTPYSKEVLRARRDYQLQNILGGLENPEGQQRKAKMSISFRFCRNVLPTTSPSSTYTTRQASSHYLELQPIYTDPTPWAWAEHAS
jgi:hypothetical protein